MKTLKKGMSGEDVKVLQQILGVGVDGIFGSQTEMVVKSWQTKNGLVSDGIVGKKTWEKLINSVIVNDDNIGTNYSPLTIHITKSSNRPIEFIVIHYTAGANSKDGSALKEKKTFENGKASADFCVDDKNIIQFNPDLKNYYCWSCGEAKYKNSLGGSLYGVVTNKNSISIEICSNLDKDFSAKYPNHKGWNFKEESLKNAIKLIEVLMKRFNIPIDKVVRHYDVSGKLCPGIIGWNNEFIYTNLGVMTKERSNSSKWIEFKKKINGIL